MKFTIFKDNGDLITAMEYSIHLALERFKVLEALPSNISKYKSPYQTIKKDYK